MPTPSDVLRLIDEAYKQKATFLDLSNFGIIEIPHELKKLANFLKGLNLGEFYRDLQTGEFVKSQGDKELNTVHSKSISVLLHLHQLQTLYIRNNQIGYEGARALSQLTNLQTLDISSNQIGDEGARALSQLTNLQTLDISSNQIGYEGARALSQLTNLQTLDISYNKIGYEGALVLSQLTNLQALYISSNQIGDEGARALSQLTNLQTLDIRSNQIGDEGARALSQLTNLQALYISSNQIGYEGARALSQLTNLQALYMNSNQIGDEGARALSQLTNLQALDINSNQIANFPLESYIRLIINSLQSLRLSNNPITNLPINDLDDIYALRSYVFSLQIREETIINKYVKINLLGTGEVGKTEWTRLLIQGKYKPNQKRTHGIQHRRWDFKGSDELTYSALVWDYGGQEYYHGTHHLFLRESHLYIVLWSKSVSDTNDLEVDDYAYWLGNIRHFAPSAQIILLQNKCDIGPTIYPNSEVIDSYNILPEHIDFISVEGAYLKDKKWVRRWQSMRANLQYTIEEYAQRLTLNQKWVDTRIELEEKEALPLWVSLEQFRKLVNIDKEQEEGFISYLEFTGDALYFKEVEELKDKVFLKPIRLAEKIYTIFSKTIKDRDRGVFTRTYLTNKLGSDSQAEVFLEIMKQFHLIFEEPKAVDQFIIPQYLPEYVHSFKETMLSLLPLAFELIYPDFLHEGLVFRFIAQYGQFAQDSTAYWKYGLLFEHPIDQLTTLVYYEKKGRKIRVHIKDRPGKSKVARELFEYFAFKKRLDRGDSPSDIQPEEEYPKIENKNRRIDWASLHPRLILSTDEYHYLSVKETHDNILNNLFYGHCIHTHKRIKLDYMAQNLLANDASGRKLRVFFSYSHKDEAYRDELEKHLIMLKRSNLIETWHDRKIIPGDNWDNSIMENLKHADVILLLLSVDFLASEYIWEKELSIIRERQASNDNLYIVPIFLRHCDLTDFDQMSYQGLPNDKDWILSERWPYRDKAFETVAHGLRKLLDNMSKKV